MAQDLEIDLLASPKCQSLQIFREARQRVRRLRWTIQLQSSECRKLSQRRKILARIDAHAELLETRQVRERFKVRDLQAEITDPADTITQEIVDLRLPPGLRVRGSIQPVVKLDGQALLLELERDCLLTLRLTPLVDDPGERQADERDDDQQRPQSEAEQLFQGGKRHGTRTRVAQWHSRLADTDVLHYRSEWAMTQGRQMLVDELIGLWSVDAQYGPGAQSDTWLILKPDGTGRYEEINWTLCSADFFRWATPQAGLLRIVGEKCLQISADANHVEEVASILGVLETPYEIAEEDTPSGKRMRVLRVSLIGPKPTSFGFCRVDLRGLEEPRFDVG